MQRKKSIQLLIGGISYLLFTNSCNKIDTLIATENEEVNLDKLFAESIPYLIDSKPLFLVSEVRKNCNNDNLCLRDKFMSQKCDEMVVYGRIRKLSQSYKNNLNNMIRKIIFHNNSSYEVVLYDNELVIKLPVAGQNPRNLNVKYKVSKRIGSNLGLALISNFNVR